MKKREARVLKSSLVLISLLFSLYSFSQIEILNKSLTEPDLKLLYAGHPNTIALSAVLQPNQTLKSTGSEIQQIDSVTFILTPRFSTGVDTLSIVSENNVEQSDFFKILNMPVAAVQIGGITQTNKFATISTILVEPNLKIIPNGLYLDNQIILSFWLSIYDVNGTLVLAFDETNDYEFSQEQIKQIKNLKLGDQLEVSKVKVQDGLGISRILQGYRLTIK